MFCPQCGKEIAEGQNFCASCGYSSQAQGQLQPIKGPPVQKALPNEILRINKTLNLDPTEKVSIDLHALLPDTKIEGTIIPKKKVTFAFQILNEDEYQVLKKILI